MKQATNRATRLLLVVVGFLAILLTPSNAVEKRAPQHALSLSISRSTSPSHADLASLIRRSGYDVQQHFAETDDGFVLGLFRILRGSSEEAPRPVILQHGLLDSGATWVLNGRERSLGFILADRGFDVWLANSRGSTYSRNHTGFSTESKTLWDFTLNDMAQYDLPATVEYVRRHSVPGGHEPVPVGVVAHSQGGAIALASLASGALRPDHVSALVTLAPAVYLKYISSVPLQFLADLHVDELFKKLGEREFLPSRVETSDLFGEFCSVAPEQCASILTAICGFNEQNVDTSRLPTYLAYAPSGTSVKNMAHWAQRVRAAERKEQDGFSFRRYGDGDEYDLTDIRVPVSVIYGVEDKLADPVDIRHLIDTLGDAVVFEKGLLGYEHIDFTWSTNAFTDVYPQVVRVLDVEARLVAHEPVHR